MTEEHDFERAQRKLENRCTECGRDLTVDVWNDAVKHVIKNCSICRQQQLKDLTKTIQELDADRSDRVMIVGRHTAKWFK